MSRNANRGTAVAPKVIVLATAVVMAAALLSVAPSIAQEASEDAPDQPTKLIKMQARNWFWDPEQIRVKQGTRVVIEIESFDAPHAFQLKAFGVKVNLPQDKKTRVEFVADEVGEFSWRCSRPCGNGCPKMRGKLVVTE